jgi:sugar phosphate isomerase/epimerase
MRASIRGHSGPSRQRRIGKFANKWQAVAVIPTTRREFLKTAAVAAAGLAAAPVLSAEADRSHIKLGMDNFAVRAMNWKAPELIEYAAKLKTDSILISDLPALGSFDEANLKRIRALAVSKGIQIHLGTWSICPTSKAFKKDWGTAEEHLQLGIRCAQTLGSPVLRVILGTREDRSTPGGIEARIADTVKLLKPQKSFANDHGVKIAVENHAGDMQAWELVELIEAAGRDFVGANMDSGNATWTAEDPMRSLEILGPYALTTSLRESAAWETETGATVQWVAMGEGNTDLKAYFKRFAELCPGVPVHVETISGFNRDLPYLKADYWKVFPKARAQDLVAFIAYAKKGKPRQPWKNPGADEQSRKLVEQEFQRGEIEKSIEYLRGIGLGPQNA